MQTTTAAADAEQARSSSNPAKASYNFLRNAWYVAAWSSEVQQGLLGRRLLDVPVVMWRTAAGEVTALGGICPHRFAPLERGRLNGNRLECGYHGLQFDATGACVHSPHGDGKIPSNARVAAFPVVERDNLVWIWMGAPEKASADRIPDMSFLAGRTSRGFLTIRVNYQLMADNLLDLTHIQFVHPSTLGTEIVSRGELTVRQEGTTVHADRWCVNGHAPPSSELRLPIDGRPVDHWLEIKWQPAGVMTLTSGVVLTGRPRSEGWEGVSAHLLTPETPTTTHYFFGSARDPRGKVLPNDLGEDDKPFVHPDHPFLTEDRPMLESVQGIMGHAELMSLHPVLLVSDAGALRVRRVLADLIAKEME
jgi:phenylpropionate dioxygenase-like ring-hydroxylating dioxygenase large terminal subunit